MSAFDNNSHRFMLTPYEGPASRVACPYCDHKQCFSQYIDTVTGEIIAATVGRCNREDKCGAHYTPSQYLKDHPQDRKRFFEDEQVCSNNQETVAQSYKPIAKDTLPVSYIDPALFKRSLSAYECNNLYLFLCAKFGEDIATAKTGEYFLGTSKQWGQNCCVYWQIDEAGKIRSGKIMYVDAVTGKRVKEPFTYVTWVHSALKLTDYNLKQCLFGLHLVNLPENKEKPVAIVESEKTAIIASIYLPEFVWLATGAKLHLNEHLFTPLAGREVTFYPDLGAYGEWVTRTEKLKHIISVKVESVLNMIATDEEYKSGLDVADYLLRQDFRQLKLRAQFMEALLGYSKDDTEGQNKILQNFLERGLQKSEAVIAINTLIEEYGFIAA